jgi:hypothetical protein
MDLSIKPFRFSKSVLKCSFFVQASDKAVRAEAAFAGVIWERVDEDRNFTASADSQSGTDLIGS